MERNTLKEVKTSKYDNNFELSLRNDLLMEWYENYYDNLIMYSKGYLFRVKLYDVIDAEDIVSDAFLVLFLLYMENPASYLRSTIANKIRKRLREKGKKIQIDINEINHNYEIESSSLFEKSYYRPLLHNSINKLKGNYLKVINLYLNGYDYEEISNILGKEENYIYVLMSRAKKRLKEIIESNRA